MRVIDRFIRTAITLLLLVWNFLNSSAQENKTLKSISILPTLKNDTVKLKLLNSIISELPNGQWEKYNAELKALASKLSGSKQKEISRIAKIFLATAINNEGFYYDEHGDLDKAIALYQQSISISREIKDIEGEAVAINNIADLYQKQGEISKALEFYNNSLALRKRAHDQKGIAESLNNLGYLYSDLGQFSKALDYYQQSLKIREKIHYEDGITELLLNIGNLYENNLSEPYTAIDYYKKSLSIPIKSGNKRLIAYALNSIGSFHKHQALRIKQNVVQHPLVTKHIDSALVYYTQSLSIRKEIDDKEGLGASLQNIGSAYQIINQFDSAMVYYTRALETRRLLGDKKDIASSLTDIGNLCFLTGDIKASKKFTDEAYSISREIGFPENIKQISKLMSEICYSEKDYMRALELYHIYIQMRDSIQNQEAKKEIFKQKFKFEYDKKAEADSLIALEEKKVVEAKFEKERTQRLALYGGLALLFLFFIVLFNRFRITQRQKNTIELKEQETLRQKILVERKNQEILSSIEYAKRIQATILPPLAEIKKNLPDSFVLYLPKDIVAGDFYWMKQIQSNDSLDDLTFIAVCDCTGHGVPGALVSLVCSKALDKAVMELGLIQPAQVLDKVAEIVIADFNKKSVDQDEIKDGMDISLCRINDKRKHLQWAGANNFLWIINKEGTLVEFKPDKQPIGKTDTRYPFRNHDYYYAKGDTIYMFTDGITDQFGGTDGKKFQRRRLKELLLSIHTESMSVQYTKINEHLKAWMGHEEQVDDICVIGMKV